MLKISSENVRNGSNEIKDDENQNRRGREWNPIRVRIASAWNGTRIDRSMSQNSCCDVVEVNAEKDKVS